MGDNNVRVISRAATAVGAHLISSRPAIVLKVNFAYGHSPAAEFIAPLNDLSCDGY